MRFHVLTLFPDMIESVFRESVTGRALEKGIVSLETINIRDFANNKYKHVDDYIYGGGSGMLMQAEPVFLAFKKALEDIGADYDDYIRSLKVSDSSDFVCTADSEQTVEASDNSDFVCAADPEQIVKASDNSDPILAADPEQTVEASAISDPVCAAETEQAAGTENTGSGRKLRVLYMSPQGRRYDQSMAEELSGADDVIILCGHYEGIDERAIELIKPEEVSIGDFVLTGGELPAALIMDSVTRLLPGALGSDESAVYESFYDGLLEYPQYTRPEEYMGLSVPPVLLSGHHKNIEAWRHEQALERTRIRRPDMYERYIKEHPPAVKKKKRKN